MPRLTARLLKLLQDVRASYWFVPGLFVLGALILAAVMGMLDRAQLDLPLPRALVSTQADGARAVLSVIAQAVIGVAGVMFSMTLVAVSFASSNYGPRLIGNFMRDRGNQITFGVMTGTFVYALIVLRSVQDPSAADAQVVIEMYVPHLSLLMAMALALASVLTMIYFIHHIPETVNVGNITAGLGRRLLAGIDALGEVAQAPDPVTEGWPRIASRRAGYIQALDVEALGEMAKAHGCQLAVVQMPGDFLAPGQPLFATDREVELPETIHRTYALGTERTEYQNLLFIVQQLVEIIARALSPGINDPYTAMNCLNWLKVALVAMAARGGIATGRVERDGVFLSEPGFEDVLRMGLGGARQYIAADRLCALHVLSLLDDLEGQIDNEAALGRIRHQRRALLEAVPEGARYREELHDRLAATR